MRNPVFYVPTVDASDLPQEVEDWCVNEYISIHYGCAIYQIELNGNPLQLFFEENEVKFSAKEWKRGFAQVGIIGT